MKHTLTLLTAVVGMALPAYAQPQPTATALDAASAQHTPDSTASIQAPQTGGEPLVTPPFLTGWYVDAGANTTLLFPYGHNPSHIFPNGQAFGISVAIGKWFTPLLGGRFKVDWNNGLVGGQHATWYSPYGVPGGNRRRGGFITFTGDIELSLPGIFGTYRADRRWNLIAAPRAGGWIDIGKGTGAHVLGAALMSTYRVGERVSLLADVGYQFVSSVNGVRSGKGSGSNGYAEIGMGVEVDLSDREFHRAGSAEASHRNAVVVPGLWAGWFVQAGIGLSLLNPYGTSARHVFPRGATTGINMSAGKWFAPEAGLRGGFNWQNGITANRHASYLDPEGQRGVNHSQGGYLALFGDMLFSVHNIVGTYKPERIWEAVVYPRMGITWNFSSDNSQCPIVGVGTEHTFRLTPRLKLYAGAAYQFTTGGFLREEFHTGSGCGSNGWLDITAGVQVALGRSKGLFHRLPATVPGM